MKPKAYWLHDARNWGDVFTPFLFENAFGVDVEWATRDEAEVFGCGSLLERISDGFSGHVLGAGMGFSETRRDLTNVKAPLLLRGQRTAERCRLQRPARLGDPAILASMFVNPNIEKTHRYGLIPHYVDKDHQEVIAWVNKGAQKIDIEGGIRQVIDAVASCEMVVSSSLHGLVVADSLGIPCKFVRLSEWVLGGEFKFSDYYSAYEEKANPASTIEAAFKACRGRDVTAVRKDVLDVFTEYVETLNDLGL